MPQPATVTPIPTQNPDAAGVQRRHNEGHGRRLTAAFEALEAFPALAESRDRLLRLVTAERVSPGIFETLAVLGRAEALHRIDAALAT